MNTQFTQTACGVTHVPLEFRKHLVSVQTVARMTVKSSLGSTYNYVNMNSDERNRSIDKLYLFPYSARTTKVLLSPQSENKFECCFFFSKIWRKWYLYVMVVMWEMKSGIRYTKYFIVNRTLCLRTVSVKIMSHQIQHFIKLSHPSIF